MIRLCKSCLYPHASIIKISSSVVIKLSLHVDCHEWASWGLIVPNLSSHVWVLAWGGKLGFFNPCTRAPTQWKNHPLRLGTQNAALVESSIRRPRNHQSSQSQVRWSLPHICSVLLVCLSFGLLYWRTLISKVFFAPHRRSSGDHWRVYKAVFLSLLSQPL